MRAGGSRAGDNDTRQLSHVHVERADVLGLPVLQEAHAGVRARFHESASIPEFMSQHLKEWELLHVLLLGETPEPKQKAKLTWVWAQTWQKNNNQGMS